MYHRSGERFNLIRLEPQSQILPDSPKKDQWEKQVLSSINLRRNTLPEPEKQNRNRRDRAGCRSGTVSNSSRYESHPETVLQRANPGSEKETKTATKARPIIKDNQS